MFFYATRSLHFLLTCAGLLILALVVAPGCDSNSASCKQGQALLDGRCQAYNFGDTSGSSDSRDQTGAEDSLAPDSTPVTDTNKPIDLSDPDLAQNDAADAQTSDQGSEDQPVNPDLTPDIETCTPPTFNPGPESDWEKSIVTGAITILGNPNHRGQDVVVNPTQLPVLIGKFTYGGFLVDKDLKEEYVDVYLRSGDCVDLTKLGSMLTSTEGQYGTQYGFKDDGGRIFFEMAKEKLPAFGRYDVKMVVRGDLTRADFSLFVVPKGRKAVVFDIDATLTTGDGELFKEILDKVLSDSSYEPEMRVDGDTVVHAYHNKGYMIIYLTGRPEMLHNMSRAWLKKRGFPTGIVHLTDEEFDALPTSGGVKDYKKNYLLFLKNDVGLDIVYAYGNASTDIDAYEEAGIPKERTFIIGKNAGDKGTQPLTDYTSHLGFVNSVPAP